MAAKSSKHRSFVPKTYVDNPDVHAGLMDEPPFDAPAMLFELQEEIVGAHRGARALAIALVRLKRIKPVSKEIERKATRRILQIVSKNLRHTDKCGLLNEDEVLAILPGADERGCHIAMNRLLSASFSKIAESLHLEAQILIAELGEAESNFAAFLDRVRAEENISGADAA